MKNIKFIIYILLLSACEKVVYIDLNTSDPKLVVEANITDSKYGQGYYLNAVKLSRTVNYYDGNVFPAVNNASVFISDDLGNIDTLKPMNHFKRKKPLSGLLKLIFCGEYRGRTDDLLHAITKNALF